MTRTKASARRRARGREHPQPRPEAARRGPARADEVTEHHEAPRRLRPLGAGHGPARDDDASAALDERADDPVWRELLARASSQALRSTRLVLVEHCTSRRDKRITDEAWRALDRTARSCCCRSTTTSCCARRRGASATAMKLTQRDTRAYVDGCASSRRRRHGSTAPRLLGQAKRLQAVGDGGGVGSRRSSRDERRAEGEAGRGARRHRGASGSGDAPATALKRRGGLDSRAQAIVIEKESGGRYGAVTRSAKSGSWWRRSAGDEQPPHRRSERCSG